MSVMKKCAHRMEITKGGDTVFPHTIRVFSSGLVKITTLVCLLVEVDMFSVFPYNGLAN